jgi:hypothetical protein
LLRNLPRFAPLSVLHWGAVDPRKTAVVTATTQRGTDDRPMQARLLAPDRWPGRLRRSRLGATRRFALSVWVLTFVILCARNTFVFNVRIYEDGDAAANSILVDKALRFHLLVGHYSRVGFHHPGPAYLYVQAAGQRLAHGLLHLTPSPYGGQLVGVFALNAAFVACAGLVLRRRLGSGPLAWAGVATVLVFLAGHGVLASSWMPHLNVAPFVLLLVASAGVAAAGLADLPLVVLAAGFLVHGHVSFLSFVAIDFALLAGWGWYAGRGRRRELLAAGRSPLIVSGLLATLFVAPMALDLLLHWPGQWGLYWRYLHLPGHTHGLGAAWQFVEWFWSAGPAGPILFAVAAALGVTLAFREPDRSRRRFLLASVAVAAVATIAFLGYVMRGVDLLPEHYIGYFYWAVPLQLIVVAVVGMGGQLVRARPRTTAGNVLLAAASLVALIVTATLPGLVAPGDNQIGSANLHFGRSYLPQLVAAVRADPSVRSGAGQLGPSGMVNLAFPHDIWPAAIGLVEQASREGLHVCAANPRWANMFTGKVCPQPAEVRLVLMRPDGARPTIAGRVIWRDASLVAVVPPGHTRP